jgi:general secretion pathway protein I
MRGFTLLEVLIAFVIATLAISVMIGVAAGSLQASRTAARYNEAVVRAQSRLAEAVTGGALVPGEREGDDGGGYHWRVRVTQSAGAVVRPTDPSASGLTLYAVTVWIIWHEGARTRDVRLDSEHIGQAIRAP